MKKLSILCLLLIVISGSKAWAQAEIELIDSHKILTEAVKLTDLGKYDAAIDLYKKIPVNDTNYEVASYEYAYTLGTAERNDQAITICREGIKKNNENTHLFYVLLGNCLDNTNHSEEAIKVYDEGIAKFPKLFLLHYNKAAALFNLERYDDAITELKISLSMNSRHVRSHLLLGEINARFGRTVQAMLCFNMAVLLQNKEAIAKECINKLELLANNKFEKESGSLKPSNDETANFDDVLTLLESGISSNAKFKSKTKLGFAVVNQNQVFFESLKYDPNANDYYMEHYVKFFEALNKEGYFVPFSYYTLASFDIQKVKDYQTKNKPALDKFVNWAGGKITESIKYRDNMRVQYYDNFVVYSIGNFSDNADKVANGKWQYFFPNGNIKSEGSFVNGEKNGPWTYYYYNGKVKKTENYINGKDDGKQEEYYESGKLALEYYMTNGEINGKYSRYYMNGQLSETGEFNMGKRVGEQVYYFVNGVVQTVFKFTDGLQDGYNKVCYPSGKTKTELTFLKGKYNGEYREYFENDTLKETFSYVNGKRTGPYKAYYYNGQLQREGTFDENGKKVGLEKEYHFNGNLQSEEQYANGDLEGESKYYDLDGILYSTVIYKNKRVQSLKYFNKANEMFSNVDVPKGKQIIKTYNPEGTVAGEGSYYDNCLQGKWTYYDRTGTLESEKEYKSGVLDGQMKYYHPNGKLMKSYTMIDGEIDGYYKSYFINGQLEAEGWYVKGQQQGLWKHYYINGNLEAVDYFLNDEAYGRQLAYHYNGDLATEEQRDGFMYNGSIEYDTVGKVWASGFLEEGSGTYELKTVDGKIIERSQYVNGNRVDSLVAYYYANMKKRVSGYFVSDRREGQFTWYFSNGNKSAETYYLHGNQEGAETYYFENGNISSTSMYIYDKDNGFYRRYYPNGKMRIESKYVDGDREGYRKFYNIQGAEMFRINYYDNKPVYITYLDQNGKETKPINIGSDSIQVITKYQGGQKSAMFSFKSGTYQGAYVEYYPDGKVQMETTMYYGNYHGLFRYYYPNGKVMLEETNYYGQSTGPSKTYYENGNIRSDENYENGSLNGYARYYNEAGKLIRLAYYNYSDLMYEKIY